MSVSAQCGVRDLPDSTQKKILAKFILLDACDSARVIDSLHILDLRSDKLDLAQDLEEAAAHIEELNKAAIRRRKWPFISGAVGIVAGWILRSRIQ